MQHLSHHAGARLGLPPARAALGSLGPTAGRILHPPGDAPKEEASCPPTSHSKLSSKGSTALMFSFLSPPGTPHQPELTCRFWSGFQYCQEKQEERSNRQEPHPGSVRPHSSSAGRVCCREKTRCSQC